MSPTRLLYGLAAGGLLLALLFGQAGRTVADTAAPTAIVVTGADATRDVAPAQNGTLNTHLSAVGARPQVQFGEGLRYTALPASLPSALQTLASGVSARVQMQFTESNRALTLGYPSAIITDTAPPQITQVGVVPAGANAVVQWTTNEFANSTVYLGASSGNYTLTVNDPLFAKTHALAVSGLTPGNTYFYKVRSVDRNGNLAESGEASFVATRSLYLPLVLR